MGTGETSDGAGRITVTDYDVVQVGDVLQVASETRRRQLPRVAQARRVLQRLAAPRPGAADLGVATSPGRGDIADDGSEDDPELLIAAHRVEHEIGDLLNVAVIHRSQDRLRRIRLWADDQAADFPFEFASGEQGPLALMPRLSLVRAVPSTSSPTDRRPGEPVIVAAFPAMAPDHPRLDLSDDRLAVVRSFVSARASSGADPNAGLEVFQDPALRVEDLVDALHLIERPIVMILNGPGRPGQIGFADGWIPIGDLVSMLHGVDLRLVVLAMCHSATGGSESCAAQLASAGVPLVVGMGDLAEKVLTRHFIQSLLESLLRGATVDDAVRAGRHRMIDHATLRQHGVPVLVTAVDDRRVDVATNAAVVLPLHPSEGSSAAASEEHSRRGQSGSLPREFHRHGFEGSVLRNLAVARIEERLREVELAVLSGRRGLGKTHLAREVCRRSTADLVWWANAESEDALVASLAALGHRLGLGLEAVPDDGVAHGEDVSNGVATDQDAAAATLEWLAATDATWLVVLDNLDDPAVSQKWIPHAPTHGATLVTTIDSGLLRPHAMSLEPLSLTEAIELLQIVTGLTDVREMAELVELLDRLPLAIHHAGSYIREHFVPVPDYVARLRRSVATLGDDVARIVCRQGLETLTPRQAAFFQVLCHLDIDAIPQALLRSEGTETALGMGEGDIDQVLHRLQRTGLAEADFTVGALRIHRLTAKVALADDGGDGLLGAIRLLLENWPDRPDATAHIATMLTILPSAERLAAELTPDTVGPDVLEDAMRLWWAVGQYLVLVDQPHAAARHLAAALAAGERLGHRGTIDLIEIDLSYVEYQGTDPSQSVTERNQLALRRVDALLDRLEPASPAWPLARARRGLYRAELGEAGDELDDLADVVDRLDNWDLTIDQRYAIEVRHVVRTRSRAERLEEAYTLASRLADQMAQVAPDGRRTIDALNVAAGTARRVASIRPDGWLEALDRRQRELVLCRDRVDVATRSGAPGAAAYEAHLSRSLNNAALLMADLNRTDEAEALGAEAVDLAERIGTTRRSIIAIRVATWAWTAFARGDLRAAAERFARAADLGAEVNSRNVAYRRAGGLLCLVLGEGTLDEIGSLVALIDSDDDHGPQANAPRILASRGLARALVGDLAALDLLDQADEIQSARRLAGDMPSIRIAAYRAVAFHLLGRQDEADAQINDVETRISTQMGGTSHWVSRLARTRPTPALGR